MLFQRNFATSYSGQVFKSLPFSLCAELEELEWRCARVRTWIVPVIIVLAVSDSWLSMARLVVLYSGTRAGEHRRKHRSATIQEPWNVAAFVLNVTMKSFRSFDRAALLFRHSRIFFSFDISFFVFLEKLRDCLERKSWEWNCGNILFGTFAELCFWL